MTTVTFSSTCTKAFNPQVHVISEVLGYKPERQVEDPKCSFWGPKFGNKNAVEISKQKKVQKAVFLKEVVMKLQRKIMKMQVEKP